MGAWAGVLEAMLLEDAQLPRKEKRTAQRLHDALVRAGFGGSYPTVQRFVKAWTEEQRHSPGSVFIPRRERQRDKDPPDLVLTLRFPATHRALHRGIGSAKPFFYERVVQALSIAPLTHGLAAILVQQLQQARGPRSHHREALGPCSVLGCGDFALEVLLDCVARGAQASCNLADAQLLDPTPATDLTDRFHA
jgi:hypothetical protein